MAMSTATTKSNFVKFSHLHSRVLPIASPSSSLAFTRRLACLGRARAWSLSLSQYNGSVLLKPNTNTGRRRRDDIYCLASSPSAAAAVDKGEGIQITEIKEPNGRVRINVKVPPSICKESYEEVLTVLRKETQIPGFRRGEKIPDNVLINYVGKEKIKTAAIEAVLNRTLPEAMSSVKDRALKDSEHIETKFNALQAAFSPSSFLSYDVAVDLAPEVKWISPKAYKNLKVVVKVESDVAIEKAAEAELKSRHKDLGSLKIVQDRGTQIGDVVVLDISATRINEDGTDGDKLSFTEQKGKLLHMAVIETHVRREAITEDVPEDAVWSALGISPAVNRLMSNLPNLLAQAFLALQNRREDTYWENRRQQILQEFYECQEEERDETERGENLELMPNLLNKDKNKKEYVGDSEAAQRALILEQQAEQRRRFKRIAEEGSGGNGSNGSGEGQDVVEWVLQFPATLRGVAIDWYSDIDKQKVTTWANLQKEFQAEFRLLRDDNEIVAEIYSTKQGKKETVCAYGRRLKELLGKMDSQPADGLKKRWFVEGLRPSLRKKMKIVSPTSYSDAYNRVMDLESEHKTSK
ncbi:uncharacterized protein LOC131045104 [Cryptomeria japonica]|uniref:uncharacterized protein LOC131045104 n=1 Tax=Cryptomeria japonica TaxID=3369 RepID=UPI0027D9E9A4|nr:uncharacterized protein LOC131045104 [Cryptomeria japonica]